MLKGTGLEITCLEKRTKSRKIAKQADEKVPFQTDCQVPECL